jgi:hypothetical protein
MSINIQRCNKDCTHGTQMIDCIHYVCYKDCTHGTEKVHHIHHVCYDACTHGTQTVHTSHPLCIFIITFFPLPKIVPHKPTEYFDITDYLAYKFV